MDLIQLLDVTASTTGIIGTALISMWSDKKIVRFYAFVIYIGSNLTLGTLAHLKGIPFIAVTQVVYLFFSLLGTYRNRPPFN